MDRWNLLVLSKSYLINVYPTWNKDFYFPYLQTTKSTIKSCIFNVTWIIFYQSKWTQFKQI